MLSLFPLNLVVFPHEELNLHIFEPRYKQLITKCLENKSTFGIPVFMENKVYEYGTEVLILDLVNQYADGRMDIKTQGIRVFKIVNFANPMPNRLHAGGTVEYLENDDDSYLVEKILLLELVHELYEILKVENKVKIDTAFISFQLAHKLGLGIKQEYELLSMATESMRINFLTEHLRKAIPIVRNMEKTKGIIRLNGHFRHLDPLKLN